MVPIAVEQPALCAIPAQRHASSVDAARRLLLKQWHVFC